MESIIIGATLMGSFAAAFWAQKAVLTVILRAIVQSADL
jgi:hypothetical protein